MPTFTFVPDKAVLEFGAKRIAGISLTTCTLEHTHGGTVHVYKIEGLVSRTERPVSGREGE